MLRAAAVRDAMQVDLAAVCKPIFAMHAVMGGDHRVALVMPVLGMLHLGNGVGSSVANEVGREQCRKVLFEFLLATQFLQQRFQYFGIQRITAHGGQIEVVSQPGVGSCFTLAMPVTAAVPTAAERH